MVTCPYCKKPASLMERSVVDEHNHKGMVWACIPCDAWVATHYNSDKPIGRLADAELRVIKAEALEAFTSLWKAWDVDRRTAYAWLAEQMDIPLSMCDFGKFDVSECVKAYDVANNYIPNWWGDEE
jgi:hypothetical protein